MQALEILSGNTRQRSGSNSGKGIRFSRYSFLLLNFQMLIESFKLFASNQIQGCSNCYSLFPEILSQELFLPQRSPPCLCGLRLFGCQGGRVGASCQAPGLIHEEAQTGMDVRDETPAGGVDIGS